MPRRRHEDREAAKIAKNVDMFFVVIAVFVFFEMGTVIAPVDAGWLVTC